MPFSRIKFVILIIIIFLARVWALHSSDLSLYEAENDLSQQADTTQMVLQSINENEQSNNRIDSSEFMIADSPRYTITGNMPRKETDINPWAFGAVTGAYTAFMIGQHIIQTQTIWEEKAEFKIMEDGHYAMQADKAGHFFGAYFMAYLFDEGLLASGLSYDAANTWGAVMGLSYQLYIEIMDGFGAKWGFSPSDFYADVAGALFYTLQHHFTCLQNFTPKFMYVPADWHGELKRKPHDFFIDDYSSHTLWLSMNVHNMLPRNLKPYWPDWLELSFGYAARNLCVVGDPEIECDPVKSNVHKDVVWGSPRFVVSLDYNLIKLLPDGPNFWNWLRQSLNYLKWPSPAIEFGEKTRFYLFYPFQINF